MVFFFSTPRIRGNVLAGLPQKLRSTLRRPLWTGMERRWGVGLVGLGGFGWAWLGLVGLGWLWLARSGLLVLEAVTSLINIETGAIMLAHGKLQHSWPSNDHGCFANFR